MRLLVLLFLLLLAAPAGAAEVAVKPGAVIAAPERFQLLGLRWKGAEDAHARVRARRDGGRWTRWVELHASGHGARRVTEPVWTGHADRFQVRVGARVRGLRAHLISVPTRKRRPRASMAARRQAQTGPGAVPPIIPRDDWGAQRCKPKAVPDLGRVQLAFVHHTVSANDYAPEDSASMVLAICRYHQSANGWNDLGYNFVVDQYGQIFEGRAGGTDQPVVGAQAQGWNSESTGIAVLGTHTDNPASEAALQSVAKIIAWKLPLHGAPTTGTVTVRSAGGSANRYPEGTEVALPRIAGHRDGGRTECPGGQLYAQLPRIRELVGDRRPAGAPPSQGETALTAAAAVPSILYPEQAQVVGRLARADGAGVEGANVRLEYRGSDGRFRELARALTGPDGTWAIAAATAFTRTLRAVYDGDVAHAPATSPSFAVSVAPALTIRRTRRRVPAGRRVDLRGSLRPAKGALTLLVERDAGERYVRSRKVRVRVSRSAWRGLVRIHKPGLYRFSARFAGDARNAPRTTGPVFVRVTRTRAGAVGGSSAK